MTDFTTTTGTDLFPSGTITISHTTGSIVDTPSGTEFKVEKEKGISPRLYFSFVKSKLSKLDQDLLKRRVKKLQTLIKSSSDLGQDALYEDLLTQLAITIREQEAAVCGYDIFISKKDIDKFKYDVRDRKVIFVKLENFSRPIPEGPKEEIQTAKDKKVFDEFWVLAFDQSGDSSKKTNKEKIVEKDPICFGKYAYCKDKFYHIVSWEDEFCDLTLDKLVDEYKVPSSVVCPLDEEEVDRIKKEVLDKHNRLKDTNQSNWRRKALEEERSGKRKPLFPLLSKLMKRDKRK